MAIVDYCHFKDCFLLSSTHYENLKTFSLNQEYIEVASMEFDKVKKQERANDGNDLF